MFSKASCVANRLPFLVFCVKIPILLALCDFFYISATQTVYSVFVFIKMSCYCCIWVAFT